MEKFDPQEYRDDLAVALKNKRSEGVVGRDEAKIILEKKRKTKKYKLAEKTHNLDREKLLMEKKIESLPSYKTYEVVSNIKNLEDFFMKLQELGMRCDIWKKDELLNQVRFDEYKKYILVSVSVEDMEKAAQEFEGSDGEYSLDDVVYLAHKLGFDKCPAEAGLLLRLQNKNIPGLNEREVLVGMDPIRDSSEFRFEHILSLTHDDKALGINDVNIDDTGIGGVFTFPQESVFVFMKEAQK
ncbi:MAG: hypothetical protein WCF94_04205 [bacterium]